MNVEERIHNGEIRRFLHLTREKKLCLSDHLQAVAWKDGAVVWEQWFWPWEAHMVTRLCSRGYNFLRLQHTQTWHKTLHMYMDIV